MTEGSSLLLDEVEQVGANVFWAKIVGGCAEVLGEACDAADIGLDGLRREVA